MSIAIVHRFYTAREVLEQRISRTVKCNNLRYVCNGQITERHLTPRDGGILKLRMKKKNDHFTDEPSL